MGIISGEFLLVSGGRSHLVMVLQEALECLFGLLVFNSGLLFLFLLCLYFVGIEGLFLLTQFGKGTSMMFKERENQAESSHELLQNSNGGQ